MTFVVFYRSMLESDRQRMLHIMYPKRASIAGPMSYRSWSKVSTAMAHSRPPSVRAWLRGTVGDNN